jgi:hypothetical protein
MNVEEPLTEARVLAILEDNLGQGGSVSMRDYGHGLGAVRVTLAHWLSPAAKEFYTSTDWEYVGSGGLTSRTTLRRFRVSRSAAGFRLDRCSF